MVRGGVKITKSTTYIVITTKSQVIQAYTFSYHMQIIMKGGKRNHTQKNQALEPEQLAIELLISIYGIILICHSCLLLLEFTCALHRIVPKIK